MTDPPRLFDGEADDFEQALLGSAERDRGSAAAKARCIAAASSTALVATSASVASATLFVSAVKAAGVGVLLGVAVTGASVMVNGEQRPSPKAPIVTLKAVVAPSLPVRAPSRAPEQPLKAEMPVAPPTSTPPAETKRVTPRAISPARAAAFSVPPPSASIAAPPPLRDSLAREVQALDEARLALAARDAKRALALLEGYRQAFPRGALASESLVLRVQALNANGQRCEAEALARDFLAAHPDDAQARKLAELFERGK